MRGRARKGAEMAQNFSGALKIMDLDDFIAPAQVSGAEVATHAQTQTQTDSPLCLAGCVCVCLSMCRYVCFCASVALCFCASVALSLSLSLSLCGSVALWLCGSVALCGCLGRMV
eukprot:COSAG02_NODE_187_length_30377_cov_3.636271_14_plen_115_part_00